MNKLPEEIYLHLGAHRTASSAFQSVLDANTDLFKQSRIGLTTAPRVGKQEETSFRLLFRRYFRSMRKGILLRFWHIHRTRRLINRMLNSVNTRWVLSDENLLGPIVINQEDGIYPRAKDNLRALKYLFGDRVVRIGLSIREYVSSCGLKCTTFLRFKVHHPEEVFLSILLARFVERDL
jgi:hypothetical protein